MDEATGAQVGPHVPPGIHDKAEACARPIERDFAAIATQSGRGARLNRLPAGAHQAPVRSDSAVVHAVMSLEVFRRHWRTAAFEIFRRPDHNAGVDDQLAPPRRPFLRRADPNDDIYSLFD